jgi:hypothetical protein
MSRIVDNMIALRIVHMLVTDFHNTDAFKLGIIDAHGNTLKRASMLNTDQEKSAFTYLHRLVFNMKKIINRLGGENRLKSFAAALWLVKETYQSGSRTTSDMENKYKNLLEAMNNNVILVEEEILVNKVLKEDGVAAAPANVTGAAVSTDKPKIDKKNIKNYQMVNRRSSPVQ